MAEVHTRDTDIIYVLDGPATLVTGGTIVDGKDDRAGRDPRRGRSRAARPAGSPRAT